MKIEILGCAGGEGINYRATSFLLNDSILIDAGAVANILTLAQQDALRYAVISHAHLDHIKDLGFIIDNTFESRRHPLKIIAMPAVINALETHYFNWVIWPDFTRLPSASEPVMELMPMEQPVQLDDLLIEFIEVNHPGDAYGFLIREQSTETSVVITGDTGLTEHIWQAARDCADVAAIFADTAFPNARAELAVASGHLTPVQLEQQLRDYDLLDTPVYCFHLKPAYHDDVVKDIQALERANISALVQGQILRF